MKIMRQYPDTVTIRTPMHTPRLRGNQAHMGPYALGALGDNIRMRISRVDREIIERVCAELGMQKAEFARWCTLAVAQAIEQGSSEPGVPMGKYVEETVVVKKLVSGTRKDPPV